MNLTNITPQQARAILAARRRGQAAPYCPPGQVPPLADTPGLPRNVARMLAPYADVISKYTKGLGLSRLIYGNVQHFYDTTLIAIDTATAGLIPANSEGQLYTVKVGATGQGFSVPVTLSQTNNLWGDKLDGNTLFVGLRCGFNFYALTDKTDPTTQTELNSLDDAAAIARSFSWEDNPGNLVRRIYGRIKYYSDGAGAWAPGVSTTATSTTTVGGAINGQPGALMKRLDFPVIFPPNVGMQMKVLTGGAIQLSDTTQFPANTSALAIESSFWGVLLTVPTA